MFEIHRGKGALVMIFGIVAALLMNVVSAALYDNNYYADHTWPKVGTLLVGGVFCTAAGAYMRKHPSKVKDSNWIDGETADHFFFIPVFYWGGIFFALGLIYAVYSFFKGA
jgi:hypothetical protein